jgi:hypothetical protein
MEYSMSVSAPERFTTSLAMMLVGTGGASAVSATAATGSTGSNGE